MLCCTSRCTYIVQAASFFDLSLSLYQEGGLGYFPLHRRVKGHSCCAQHVMQHSLQLVLGEGHTADWQRLVPSLQYHSPFAAEGAETVDGAAKSSQNTSCVDQFPLLRSGHGDPSFVLLSLPLQQFLPSSSASSLHPPVTSSNMLHYKGDWKQEHMARDYMTSQRFDLSVPREQTRFRQLIQKTYSGINKSSDGSMTLTSIPIPILPSSPAQCHQPLFRYTMMEQYYQSRQRGSEPLSTADDSF